MTDKTLIFDLDGTLIDSAPDLANALNQLLGDYDLAPLTLSDVRQMIGDGAWKLVERGFEARNIELPDSLDTLVKRFIIHYEKAIAVDTVLFPGVIETLKKLKAAGHTLGVCTNKPYAPTKALLDIFDISQYMDGVVGGDSLPFKKPDGRHITQLLDDMGRPHDTAIMVGDSQNDVYAARDANIPVIFMTFGYTRISAAELKPNATLGDFSEIPAVINNL